MHIDIISVIVSIFMAVNDLTSSSKLYQTSSDKSEWEISFQGTNLTNSDEIKPHFYENDVAEKEQWSDLTRHKRAGNFTSIYEIEDETLSQSVIYNEQITINPYMAFVRVTLGYKNLHCAGTIVTKMHVLTAAKCVYDDKNQTWAKASMVDIAVGATYPWGGDGTIYESYIIYPNEEYPKNKHIDIAVIELKSEMKFSSTVNSIRLAGPTQMSFLHEMIHQRENLLVLGWGSEKDPGIIQPAMNNERPLNLFSIRLLAQFKILSTFEDCKDNIKNFDENFETCAQKESKLNVSWCPGARGGPVIWKQQQFGLVSRGTCIVLNSKFFSFTRVDTLRGYIDVNFFKSGRYKGRKSGDVPTLRGNVLLTIILFLMFTDLRIVL